MKASRKKMVLWACLTLLVAVWFEASVLSPVHGAAREAFRKTRNRVVALNTSLPCEGPLTAVAQLGGVSVYYPDCFEPELDTKPNVVLDPAVDFTTLTISDSAVDFSAIFVASLRVPTTRSELLRCQTFHGRVTHQSEIGEWLVSWSRGFLPQKDSPGSVIHDACIVAGSRQVNIAVEVPVNFLDTRIEEWIVANHRGVVQAFCDRNTPRTSPALAI